MPARGPLADVPPDQFIQARNEMARKLRERGEAEEARRVAALRRPSPALFLANQLAKRDRDSLDALIDASRRAQRAQVPGQSGDELREAMRAQREALHRLLEQAEQAAREIGTSLTLELRRRIQDTVQTAATAEPEALREGALESELSAAGFGALLTGPAAAASAASARAASAAAHTAAKATKATAIAKRAVAAATEQASAAAARANTHQRAFKAKAEERRRQVAEKRDQLLRQRELAHAEQAARRIEARARQLEQRAQQSQLAADRAREEAAEARREAMEAEAKAARLRQEQAR